MLINVSIVSSMPEQAIDKNVNWICLRPWLLYDIYGPTNQPPWMNKTYCSLCLFPLLSPPPKVGGESDLARPAAKPHLLSDCRPAGLSQASWLPSTRHLPRHGVRGNSMGFQLWSPRVSWSSSCCLFLVACYATLFVTMLVGCLLIR